MSFTLALFLFPRAAVRNVSHLGIYYYENFLENK